MTKTVLFPVRFLFTAATGRVGTNEAAVTHYLSRGAARSPDLVAAAFGWRVTPPHDGHAAEKLLGRELLPLYLEYIDDHTTRLADLGRPDLAARFSDWRTALLG